MSYLLDTCVLSELVKDKPDKNVISWINTCQEEKLYLSVITIGEIQKGISKLVESKKRRTLEKWIDNDLLERFSGRIIRIDTDIARKWGEILADAEKKGNTIPVIDALIGASSIVYKLIVVTRNVSDIEKTGADIFNPWI